LQNKKKNFINLTSISRSSRFRHRAGILFGNEGVSFFAISRTAKVTAGVNVGIFNTRREKANEILSQTISTAEARGNRFYFWVVK
jgi:hypothetical protein